MKKLCTAICYLAAWTTVEVSADGEPHTTKVIGTEFPGAYKHPASFDELANHDLYLAYFGGAGEYEQDSKVWGMRRIHGETRWSTPEVIADTPFRKEGNPVVWQAPDGLVWLFYVQAYGDTWSDSRIKAKISRDGAHSWSDSFLVSDQLGMMVRAHPIVLHDGAYLLPVYHETGHDTEIEGKDTTSVFLRLDKKTGLWKETDRSFSRTGNQQPSVVQITESHLVAYARRGGGYEPVDAGWLVRMESFDGGNTWTNGVETDIPNPNSATDFKRLKNGDLILVYNDSMNRRTPLTVAISKDQGKTWTARRNIAEGNNTFAYPVVIQTHDEKIHVIYTTNDRSTILHAVFEEEHILEARGPSVEQHVKVYYEPGRYGGWPANYGIWSWGDEVLVGFHQGYYKDQGPMSHHIDHERPRLDRFARSHDGGRNWTVEEPRVGPPAQQGAPIHFTHPDFALHVPYKGSRGGSRVVHYSYDRGKTWQETELPDFDTPGIAARTDYLVDGKHECTLFLTAAKSNGEEGRPFCVRTTDGGGHWKFLSWIGPEPAGFSIMPASARLSSSDLLVVTRRRQGWKRWQSAYLSEDNGKSWRYLNDPVPQLGEGNPASLIQLHDGRLCLSYGYRAEPFRIGARLSSDGGNTWSKELTIRGGGANRDMGYVRSTQRPDGKIVSVYYFNEATTGPERYVAATIWDPGT